jgi:hypothetical protein
MEYGNRRRLSGVTFKREQTSRKSSEVDRRGPFHIRTQAIVGQTLERVQLTVTYSLSANKTAAVSTPFDYRF